MFTTNEQENQSTTTFGQTISTSNLISNSNVPDPTTTLGINSSQFETNPNDLLTTTMKVTTTFAATESTELVQIDDILDVDFQATTTVAPGDTTEVPTSLGSIITTENGLTKRKRRRKKRENSLQRKIARRKKRAIERYLTRGYRRNKLMK